MRYLIVAGEELNCRGLSLEGALVDVPKSAPTDAVLYERLHILLKVHVEVYYACEMTVGEARKRKER